MRTPEEQLEWDLCKNDCVYFLNKYLQPEKYSPLLADFKLYPFQEDVLDAVEGNTLIVINTARQMGVSTILTGRALWKMLFNDEYKVVLSNFNLVSSIKNLDLIRDFYNQLPEFFKIGEDGLNGKRFFKLSNGSSATAIHTQTAQLCSKTFDEIFIDSAAFSRTDSENFLSAANQNVHTHGKIIISSTLYKEGWFTDMCREAEKGDFSFVYVKLPYWVHPKRGRAWRSKKDNELGSEAAKVEYDCSYVFTKEGVLVPLNDE